jgi:hypothetical protein
VFADRMDGQRWFPMAFDQLAATITFDHLDTKATSASGATKWPCRPARRTIRGGRWDSGRGAAGCDRVLGRSRDRRPR